MIQWLTSAVRRTLVRNIMALYGVRIVNQLLPLIIIPFLARVLGPDGWGMVAMVQAFATYGIIAIEYGFELTGARDVAKVRDETQSLAQLMAGILGAQAVVAVLVSTAAWLVQTMLPVFHDQPRLLFAGLAFAVVQGFYPIWYFVGQERVSLIAVLDTSVKVVAMLVIFAVVRTPDDGWLVLAAFAGAALTSTMIGFALMIRETRPARLGPGLVGRTLRLGFSVFLMRIGVLMHTTGNVFLMGLLVAPQHVAFFAAGEKLCRPLAWMMHPVNTVLLPRISHLLGQRREEARALAGAALLVMAALGLAGGLVVGLAAPWLIPLVFGDQYLPAVTVMQVMAMIIPLTVLNGAMVSQWLIPHGLDRPLTAVVMAGAAANIVLACLVVPRFEAIGMAWVTVGVEAGILAGLFRIAHRHGLRPIALDVISRRRPVLGRHQPLGPQGPDDMGDG